MQTLSQADLSQLIARSALPEDEKTRLLAALPTMSAEQQGAVTRVLLELEHNLSANEEKRQTAIASAVSVFVDNVDASVRREKKELWRLAEQADRINEIKKAVGDAPSVENKKSPLPPLKRG